MLINNQIQDILCVNIKFRQNRYPFIKKREVSKSILRGFCVISNDVLAINWYGDMQHIGGGVRRSLIHFKTFK